MKTKHIILTFLILFSIINKIDAQVTITNSLSCSVKVDYIVIDASAPPVVCTPANTCNSATGVTIGPNQSITIPAGACTNICNIIVSITALGGNSTGLPMSADLTTPSGFLPNTSPCFAGSAIIMYYASSTDFLIN